MATTEQDAMHAALVADGFAFVPDAGLRARLEARGALADWDAFAASWNALEPDTHMADHGRE